MKSLKEFIDSKTKSNSKSLALPSANKIEASINSQITSLTSLPISPEDKEKFSTTVARIATSNEVLKELSDSLETPRKNETEDEFVKRGKDNLRKIIKNKLKNM